jgi:hypothetical protein
MSLKLTDATERPHRQAIYVIEAVSKKTRGKVSNILRHKVLEDELRPVKFAIVRDLRSEMIRKSMAENETSGYNEE